MYKSILFAALMSMTTMANAKAVYTVNGKSATKLQAMMTLMRNPNANVARCYQVELTENATLRSRRSNHKTRGAK